MGMPAIWSCLMTVLFSPSSVAEAKLTRASVILVHRSGPEHVSLFQMTAEMKACVTDRRRNGARPAHWSGETELPDGARGGRITHTLPS